MPSTRPDMFLDETGECSACVAYKKRPTIDWDARKTELLHILDKHDGRCIVASSGGKDSHFIVLTLIELGASPIIVTATTDHLSDIGKRNIANLARYADTFEVTPDQSVRRKISRLGLRQVGDISYGEHMAIWAQPHRMAISLGIPLIFYGENPQNDIAGPPGAQEAKRMTRRWVTEFGGFCGLRAQDLVGQDGIAERDIEPYLQPQDGETETYFLGQFVPWDGLTNAIMARDHGFEWYHEEVEGSIGAYESLDNHQTGLHEWFKFLKFGYMRPTDIASHAIRRGHMTREDALAKIEEREVFPKTYLGMRYEEILDRIGVSVEEFQRLAERFTNRELHRSLRAA